MEAVQAASSTDLGDICDLDRDAAACINLPHTCGKIYQHTAVATKFSLNYTVCQCAFQKIYGKQTSNQKVFLSFYHEVLKLEKSVWLSTF